MFERHFSLESGSKLVEKEAHKLSAEQRQRDIFESHRHRVFALSYYMTANELEAEQILTATFISAFARQIEPDAHGVDQALLEELENRFSLAPSEPAVLNSSAFWARTSTRRTDMEEALRVLPPDERLVFLLKDVEAYATAKIATLLARSEPEIHRTLFSARVRMRNALAAAQGSRQPVAAHQEFAYPGPSPQDAKESLAEGASALA